MKSYVLVYTFAQSIGLSILLLNKSDTVQIREGYILHGFGPFRAEFFYYSFIGVLLQ